MPSPVKCKQCDGTGCEADKNSCPVCGLCEQDIHSLNCDCCSACNGAGEIDAD